MNKLEYMKFFEHWINYQFQRIEDDFHNYEVLRIVSQIVSDSEELHHWSNRDCWSMLDYAKSKL